MFGDSSVRGATDPWTPTFHALISLIQRLATSRDCQGADDGDLPFNWRQRVLAERASAMLLIAFLKPDDVASAGTVMREVIENLQFLIQTSTPVYEPRITFTTHFRHVQATEREHASITCAAVCLALRAYDDGALDVAFTLDEADTSFQLRCVSQHPHLGLAPEMRPLSSATARAVGLPMPAPISTTMQHIGDQVQVDVWIPKQAVRV